MDQTTNHTSDPLQSRVEGKDNNIQAESFGETNASGQMKEFTITHIEAQGHNVYVSAPDYKSADQWFKQNVIDKKLYIAGLEVAISGEEDIYIAKIEPEESLSYVCQAKDKDRHMNDIYNKGYDYDSDCYVFTVMDQKVRTVSVQAADEKEAFENASFIFKSFFNIETEMERSVYSASEEDIVTIEGESMDIHKEEDLMEELKKQFPDGLTVLLEDESVSRLKEFAPYLNDDNELENISLMGMVEAAKDASMAGANGLLKAELRLKPEDYDLLYACDRTYYSDELSDLGFDTGVNCTTVMLNTEDNLRESRIQTEVCPALLENLYIEGESYKDVMNIINRNNVTDDRDLKNYFNWENLRNLPKWKFDMAKQAVQEVMHKDWVEKLGPAYRDQRKMYDETMDQAAKEFGYADRHEYMRNLEWGKNNSPQLSAKLRQVSDRHMELYSPYNKKAEEAGRNFQYKENSLMVEFLRQFDNQALKVISEARIIPRNGNEWAVRCKIDGVQQSGRMVSREDAKRINEGNLRETLPDIVRKYFKDDVIETMQQSQSQGLKR